MKTKTLIKVLQSRQNCEKCHSDLSIEILDDETLGFDCFVCKDKFSLLITDIPDALYHATFQQNVNSIMQYGICSQLKEKRNFDLSEDGYIYLADTAQEAYSTLEVLSDDLDDESKKNDPIVVFQIDLEHFDLEHLIPDHHFDSDEDEFVHYQYKGSIPPQFIKLCDEEFI